LQKEQKSDLLFAKKSDIERFPLSLIANTVRLSDALFNRLQKRADRANCSALKKTWDSLQINMICLL